MATIKGQITHEAAGAIVHEDPLLFIASTSLDHFKSNVLETCSLQKSDSVL